jgi:DNA polymerase III epsilon subunit-like protein
MWGGRNASPFFFASRKSEMYVSIDIETLGLNPKKSDIIEFGAVIDDLKSPIQDLPRYHCYITKEYYRGEPYAMAMHSKALSHISSKTPKYSYVPGEYLDENFSAWLIQQGIEHKSMYCNKTGEKLDVAKITVAGKNFSGFDLRFLRRLPNWGRTVTLRHRVIDPAVLYFDPLNMEAPPSLDDCLKMAGVNKEVSHTAIDDALDVIRCLRFKWNLDF